ncbi:uncharacterized protein LOC113387986 [Ctenocephalides felis]|uniref:uncharacterized protein LOC113387986 n=1 Tax=Ctenocephalides felis TaxID=7515 RepID=UPI000E6E26F6|nr:uncharacterized protein LOC113387986 [Ctenocephalides felis]
MAYELLCKTYDNKFLIVNFDLQQIDNIPQIHTGTHETQSTFLCSARLQIRALSALYEPTKHYDLILLYMLNKKADSHTRMAWNLSRTKQLIRPGHYTIDNS